MSGRRKRSICNQSECLSGSGVSERSTSSGKVATVVSFAVVNVDLEDKSQNIDESKQKTKMLAETACLSASESMKENDDRSHKIESTSVAIEGDKATQSRIGRDVNNFSGQKRLKTTRAKLHSADDILGSQKNKRKSLSADDDLSGNQSDISSSDISHRGTNSAKEPGSNSVRSSRRKLSFVPNASRSSPRKKRSKFNSSRSQRRRSHSRHRRSRRYNRSRRGRVTGTRKVRSMLSKKRKPRKQRRDNKGTKSGRSSKRKNVVLREAPIVKQEEEEEEQEEKQPDTSPMKVIAFNETDSIHISQSLQTPNVNESRKITKDTTPYYTAKNTNYRTTFESEYTPTMASMGVKNCNCDECLRYEQRARTLLASTAPRKPNVSINRDTGLTHKQQTILRPPPKVAAKSDEVNRIQTKTELRKSSTVPNLKPVTPSGSLHTDFNTTLPPTTCSQKKNITGSTLRTPATSLLTSKPSILQSPHYLQLSSTQKSTTPEVTSLTPSTKKDLKTSANYKPERDYNPMCDCTNCRIQRTIREENGLCDCYDCISAMRSSLTVDKKNQTKQKQYKLKDPPVDGHTPKPPKRRTKQTYPWVKQLIEVQQAGRPYCRPKQRLAEKYIFKTKHQQEESSKSKLKFPRTDRSSSDRSNRSSSNIASTSRNRSAAWSLIDSDPTKSPATRTSQRSTSSYSRQTGQSSFSTRSTSEPSKTRSSYLSNQRSTTPSYTTGTTRSSLYVSTTPTTTTTGTASTTNQSSSQSDRTRSSSDDNTKNKHLTANYKKKPDKRKPWVP